MILFDLDGVIRDLAKGVLGYTPNSWYEEVNGMGIVELLNSNLETLTTSSPTPYYQIIKEFFPRPHIVTLQAENWKILTIQWLHNHFDKFDVSFVEKSSKKVDIVGTDLIVEDYPFFDKEFYKQVILIRYPYNENVKEEDCYAVVNSPEELREVLTNEQNGQ